MFATDDWQNFTLSQWNGFTVTGWDFFVLVGDYIDSHSVFVDASDCYVPGAIKSLYQPLTEQTP